MFQILWFTLEPGPVGLGPARALGAGASQGPRVHPRNKLENLVRFGDQRVPYFEVYSEARPRLAPAPSSHSSMPHATAPVS